MKALALLLISVSLLAGCASVPNTDFVQGRVRITPPVHTEIAQFLMADGGTWGGTITDAKGRKFPVFVDHRLETKTPGAIYLMAYPGRWRSVRVSDEAQFRQKLGLYVKP